MQVTNSAIQEAVYMWALKQSMEMARLQMSQTVQTAVAKMAPVQEPGKGTLLDVKV